MTDEISPQRQYPRHYETSAFVRMPPEVAFATLDDHAKLSGHMSRPSWRMGGGKMELSVDEYQGKRVGSKLRLTGRVFGIYLSLEELITEREVPHRKVWQTVGKPVLLVIAQYRLGFQISPSNDGSEVSVFIDYALPEKGVPRWLGLLFGDAYARWCARRMLSEVTAPPAR